MPPVGRPDTDNCATRGGTGYDLYSTVPADRPIGDVMPREAPNRPQECTAHRKGVGELCVVQLGAGQYTKPQDPTMPRLRHQRNGCTEVCGGPCSRVGGERSDGCGGSAQGGGGEGPRSRGQGGTAGDPLDPAGREPATTTLVAQPTSGLTGVDEQACTIRGRSSPGSSANRTGGAAGWICRAPTTLRH